MIAEGDIYSNDIGVRLEILGNLAYVTPTGGKTLRTFGDIWMARDSSECGWLVTPHSLKVSGFRKEESE